MPLVLHLEFLSMQLKLIVVPIHQFKPWGPVLVLMVDVVWSGGGGALTKNW